MNSGFLSLNGFLNSSVKSAWLLHPGFSTIHCKKTIIQDLECIEIFVLQAVKPGNGAFTKLRQELKNYNLYFVSVNNRRFARHLSSLGAVRLFESNNVCFLLKAQEGITNAT